jgi:hypothetical protein
MEEKAAWNLRVYQSVAQAFDGVVKSEYRGEKATCASAACMMFLMMQREMRQTFIDAIKLSEARGLEGNIFDTAHKIWFKSNQRAGEQNASEVALRIMRELDEKKIKMPRSLP